VRLFDGGCQRFGFVGRHHNQVSFLVDEMFDVGCLPGIVIAGRADVHFHTGIEKCFATDFLVHLRAPLVVAALRHGYQEAGPFAPACRQQQTQCAQGKKVEGIVFHGLSFGD